MTFSYTDDAIVSTSPTGRHLSTVIRRPCVLMSGWDQHAEEICKVLNERTPVHSLADLIDRGYLTDYKATRKGATVVLDFGNLEKRAQAIDLTAAEVGSGYNRVQWAEGLIRQLPETHEGRNSWLLNYGQLRERPKAKTAEELLAAGKPVEPKSLKAWVDYGQTIYAYAHQIRESAKEYRQIAVDTRTELEALKETLRAPIPVDDSLLEALSMLRAGGGSVDTPSRTFKRV